MGNSVRFGVPKVLVTAPNTPQENNRTVKTMVAQFAGQTQRNWDERWPEIVLAINTRVSESTGYSPSFPTQGREPWLPNALYDRKTLRTGRQTETPEGKLKEIFEVVGRNL